MQTQREQQQRATNRRQLRRPKAEQLHAFAVETIGAVSVTAELFSEMTQGISPDTLRRLEQAEVLERAILGLLAARARA